MTVSDEALYHTGKTSSNCTFTREDPTETGGRRTFSQLQTEPASAAASMARADRRLRMRGNR